MRFWLDRRRSAARTVRRLTPGRPHSSGSVGSRSPGRSGPEVIWPRRSSARSWYAGERPDSVVTKQQPTAPTFLTDTKCLAGARSNQQSGADQPGDDGRYAQPAGPAHDQVVPDREEPQPEHDGGGPPPGPGAGAPPRPQGGAARP